MYFDSNEYDEMNEYMKASNIVFITIWYIQSLCTYIAKCWTNRYVPDTKSHKIEYLNFKIIFSESAEKWQPLERSW